MMENKLKLSIEAGSPQLIRAHGELNFENCHELGELLVNALQRCDQGIDLALGGLDFVDSSGLRILIIGAQDADVAGCGLRIVSLTPQLDHVLTISGVRHLFDVAVSPKDPSIVCEPAAESLSSDTFELPAEVSSCCEGRDRICSFAAAMSFTRTEIDDIRLAAGEALSNAVRHGECAGQLIYVSCARTDRGLLITLEYPSECFDPECVPVPNMDDPPIGGMGIHFMRLVMDRVDYRFVDGNAVLTLEKRLGVPSLLRN